MLFGCFFNSHFVFVSGKHISFLNACAFGFAVITSTEECNAVVLAEEQLTGDTVNCCTGPNCIGQYCGYFVPAGTHDKIPAYYEY